MLSACDAGNVLLWPWVDIAAKEETIPEDPNAPPPPPPLDAVNPLDPTAEGGSGGVPNPNANTGAPENGTPFEDGKPENPAIDTGDSKPPVSAETGETLPPLPVPTETAETPTTPETPPVTPPAPTPTPAPETPTTTPAPTPAPAPIPASFYYFRPGNLAPSRHAQFDNGVALAGPQLEQCQRHAEMIVEIAIGLHQLARFADVGSQDCGDEILGGGLSGRAGHSDDLQLGGNLWCVTMSTGDLSKRHNRVGDFDDRQAGMIRHRVQFLALDEHTTATVLYGLRDEVVTIESFPTDRNKQTSGGNVSAVNRHCGKAMGRSPDQTAPGCAQNALQRQFDGWMSTEHGLRCELP